MPTSRKTGKVQQVLVLHEAVPGHIFQGTLAQGLAISGIPALQQQRIR
jgi:uncharacterized protein (DUF885 family)